MAMVCDCGTPWTFILSFNYMFLAWPAMVQLLVFIYSGIQSN